MLTAARNLSKTPLAVIRPAIPPTLRGARVRRASMEAKVAANCSKLPQIAASQVIYYQPGVGTGDGDENKGCEF